MRMWLNLCFQLHTVRMAVALVCAVTAVTLSVSPDSTQFHPYEHFIVSCPSKSWTVYRSTRYEVTPEKCGGSWGVLEEGGCKEGPLLVSDSGLYWCQNHDQTQCSPAANITVSKEKLILKSPLFPVKEGEQITLTCSFKETRSAVATSNFNTSFFLNGDFKGEFPGGQMVLSSVTREHEGLYHCEHPTKARSLQSPPRCKAKRSTADLCPAHSPALLCCSANGNPCAQTGVLPGAGPPLHHHPLHQHLHLPQVESSTS
ncbi:hypothetical protein NQD34_013472 [Periophthalmus magnuspinnatus]|nr:hypothetical protein NQD34_013472 [Periophthalmus magnuspinnatus]